MRKHRRVPIDRLISRLGLTPWNRPAPWHTRTVVPDRVFIPLTQHIGLKASPTVSVGDRVTVGQVIGDVPAAKLGTPVHASIDGRVSNISASTITISAS